MCRVLALVRSLVVGRLSAVLIAFVLSGAPRLAMARASGAPARCACPAHQRHRACPCGGCHKGGGAHASASAEAKAAHAAHERRSQEGEPSAPCMKGGCSMPEAPAAAPWSTELFTLSRTAVLTSPRDGVTLTPPSSSPLHAPHVPETPPPRRA
jgi:hypothetical protein